MLSRYLPIETRKGRTMNRKPTNDAPYYLAYATTKARANLGGDFLGSFPNENEALIRIKEASETLHYPRWQFEIRVIGTYNASGSYLSKYKVDPTSYTVLKNVSIVHNLPS